MAWIIQSLLLIYTTGHSLFSGLTFLVTTFLLWSGIEDLFVDGYYWLMRIRGSHWHKRLRDLPLEALHAAEEKPIAVFIPAWHEEPVIRKMLRRAATSIEYRRYDLFVGVYPNDPGTIREVEAVAAEFPNVHAVIGSNPGPTTKADNLNQIHQGMVRHENTTGVRYDIILMHDAEDVIDPMSLKVVNYFVPDYDMVQLPVFPLPVSHRRAIAWTYADEFAENHLKDMIVRQQFSGFVPSAGVGTGYNRWLIEFIGTSYAKNMFARASLTEDYDIALRLAMGNAKILFLHEPFGLQVATQAYFPESLLAAVKQKSRWLVGICLQSWKKYGWLGNWKFRMSLYRDRKALIANLVTMLAYLVGAFFLLWAWLRTALPQDHPLEPLIPPGSLLWSMGIATTSLMVLRLVHRAYFVSRIYGLKAGILGAIRLPVANLINFVASVRALALFFGAEYRQKPMGWDKTDHKFEADAPTFSKKGRSLDAPIITGEQRAKKKG